jgi:UDP-3-O-[3-hydroxymyristoyl] glucosamine N-acyltransferase
MNLLDIAKKLGCEIEGEKGIEIREVLPPEDNKEGSISLLIDEKVLERKREFYAVITNSYLADKIKFRGALIIENPKDVWIKLLKIFEEKEEISSFVHPTAVISNEAKIEEGVYIGPYCVIEKGVKIKKGVKIIAFVYVGKNSFIGHNTVIYPFVSIYKNVNIKDNSTIHSGCVIGADGFGFERKGDNIIKIPQIGKVEIGNNVEIGANTCVDRATVGKTEIGDYVKIDNLCQIAHNVKIGDFTVIAAQTGVAGSSKIGKNCIIAGQVGIGDHVNVGDSVILTAQTGVSKDIPSGKVYSGYMAREHREVLKAMQVFYELPKYWKKLKKMLKEL